MRRKTFNALLLLALAGLGCHGPRFHCDLATPSEVMAQATQTEKADLCEGTDPNFKPTNLVFQGGGVKGVAYVGALEVIDEVGILDGVTKVAGTSAGAITATLVALGYTTEEIREIVFTVDFSKFEDGGATGIFRLFRRYGYFKGDYFLEWMRCQVAKKTGSPDTTFQELADADRFRELQLFTTDVTSGDIQRLSAEETPDLAVALGVRMSMSIPYFFASIEHESFGDDSRRHVFVDGGVLFNYPITAFDKKTLNPDTLGFVLLDTRSNQPQPPQIHSLLSYTRSLVEADLNVQVDELRFDPANLVRTAVVNDLGVPTTDFHLGRQTKLDLIASGRECACSYLQDRPADGSSFQTLAASAARLEVVPASQFERCGWVLPPD